MKLMRKLPLMSGALALLGLLAWLALIGPRPASAQAYSFSVPDMKLQVYVQPDGQARLVYDITFQNDRYAPVIQIVDIGLPSANYDLNGLITNDKFCLSRSQQLSLTWSRRPLRLRGQATCETAYSPGEEAHQGGAYEAPVATAPRGDAGRGRATPMGSGLPVPSAMGCGGGASTDSLFPTTAGGVR